MKSILIAIIIAFVAATIDVIPILKKKIPNASKLFVFTQWIFIGLMIPFIDWNIEPWIKGLIIGELGMIPVMILTYHRNKKAIPGIVLFAAILGIGIGLAGARFIV